MAARTDTQRSDTAAWLALAGIAVLAAVALMSVLKARYDAGESYPDYSSLRADPLGTLALYEALEALPDVTAKRNFEALPKLKGASHQSLVLCGLDARGFNSIGVVDSRAIARFAADGGRVIIALNPSGDTGRMSRAFRNAVDELDKEDEEDKKEKPPAAKKPEKTKDEAKKKSIEDDEAPLARTLKVSAKAKEFFYNDKSGSPLQLKPDAPLSAEDTPLWFSNVFLDDDPAQDWDAEWHEMARVMSKRNKREVSKDKPSEPIEPSPWHTIATKSDRAMIMERRLGAGSVVVCTDRYFLSNEALWKGPNTKFLSWLIGDATQVIFEETHFGFSIGDADGIMTLARRYRMHGLFLGGILLFALYIWRNAFSLVPPNADDDLGHWRADAVAGQSTASGLEGLLRRGVGHSTMLARCVEVWESTKATATAIPADRLAKAHAVLALFKGTKHAPQAYRQVRDALHPTKKS